MKPTPTEAHVAQVFQTGAPGPSGLCGRHAHSPISRCLPQSVPGLASIRNYPPLPFIYHQIPRPSPAPEEPEPGVKGTCTLSRRPSDQWLPNLPARPSRAESAGRQTPLPTPQVPIKNELGLRNLSTYQHIYLFDVCGAGDGAQNPAGARPVLTTARHPSPRATLAALGSCVEGDASQQLGSNRIPETGASATYGKPEDILKKSEPTGSDILSTKV